VPRLRLKVFSVQRVLQAPLWGPFCHTHRLPQGLKARGLALLGQRSPHHVAEVLRSCAGKLRRKAAISHVIAVGLGGAYSRGAFSTFRLVSASLHCVAFTSSTRSP
jgi:hypothetical protein